MQNANNVLRDAVLANTWYVMQMKTHVSHAPTEDFKNPHRTRTMNVNRATRALQEQATVASKAKEGHVCCANPGSTKTKTIIQ